MIKVNATQNKGLGLFATRPIKKGEVVLIIRGELVKYTPENISKYTEDRMWHVSYDEVIIAESPGRYTNHSCNPNCGVKRLVEIVAMRDINADEEITIDYDMIEYSWTMKCLCGSENCRKYIHGYKFLSDVERKRYKGFISDYL